MTPDPRRQRLCTLAPEAVQKCTNAVAVAVALRDRSTVQETCPELVTTGG